MGSRTRAFTMSISEVPWTSQWVRRALEGVLLNANEEEYASYTDCQKEEEIEEEEIEGMQLFTVDLNGLILSRLLVRVTTSPRRYAHLFLQRVAPAKA
jgi:hypothetical protein